MLHISIGIRRKASWLAHGWTLENKCPWNVLAYDCMHLRLRIVRI